MELNIPAIEKLIKEKYRNNQSWFAEEIGIDISYLNQVMNKRKTPKSPKVITKLLEYCLKNNLDIRGFVFLP